MSSDEAPKTVHGNMPDDAAPCSKDELRAYVVTHVDEAVENGWIRPYYQPVIRTLTGKLCGLEALARWEDSQYGLLRPDVFIPALEEAKVIHLLDCCIIRQVCKHYRERANEGLSVVPISFNLSRLDFDLCDIFAEVEKAAHEYHVPRRMLNIEITESALGVDPAFMTAKMRQFHDAGYQVWMDDFGSGYSSLNVLKDFDFDELKMDMEFLNRFGEKSKTILASVVDMAKKLGIQTLAEGVETDEHSSYLRRIGCEKMQGYLFGKPLPYDSDLLVELLRGDVEESSERLYVNEVGAVNTLSMSERDLTAGNSTQGYVTSMSLATVEFSDDAFRIIDSNRVFKEGLASMGVASVEEAERVINDTTRAFAKRVRYLVEGIEQNKFARVDHIVGDTPLVLRAKHITTRNGKIALLVSIDDTLEQSERKRHTRIEDVFKFLYSIYEHVDIVHLDEDFIEPLFSTTGFETQSRDGTIESAINHFAESEVYMRDRKRYLEFMDPATMLQRILESGESFIVDFFRIRQHGGDYSWKMLGLIYLAEQSGNQVMLCVRPTHWSHDGLFQVAYDGGLDGRLQDVNSADLTMTEGSLWRALARDRNVKLFWKDDQRRYIGANQAFLDYYGFKSADAIKGKVDEDLGWYVNAVSAIEDDLRVLDEGEVVENAMAQCIVHGEMRNVVETKRPVYRNGRIIGIVGHFSDLDENVGDIAPDELPMRDPITGVFNYVGLESATWRYVDAYQRRGIDFAMVSINVESFQSINDEFGFEFGEKTLKRIGDELTAIAQHKRVVGHVHADRFVVLAQNESDEELQALCDEIEHRLSAIPHVDGTPCTIYALAGYARFSKLGDVEAMKRYNRDRRVERRNKMGESSSSDVITSSLL